MSKNQLAKYQDVVFGELTETDITTIRETIAKDCNESQFKLFMSIAKSSGANPILSEIHPVVRSGQLTTQFGIDFFVKEAKKTEGYKGYDVQMVHENDEFKMHQEKDDDGRYFIVIDNHSFGMPRGKVIGGYAFAYKEGLKPFSVIMEVDEVEHYKRSPIGMQKNMWTNQFNDMFKKHMVKRALKAAFGLNFDDDESQHKGASDLPGCEPRGRKDITPEVDQTDRPKKPGGPESEPDPVEDDEATKIKKAKDEMKKKFAILGITDKEKIGEYIAKNIKTKSDKPTLSELLGLLKIMDLEIEQKKADDELLV